MTPFRFVIRKLAPNHVSVIFGSEGCQRRVSQGHKMSKNALDAVRGFLRRVSEGARKIQFLDFEIST